MINTNYVSPSSNTILSGANKTDSTTSSTGASFSALLQEQQTASMSTNKQLAPTLSEFMAATGADFNAAANLVSGVLGANTDGRDWSAIMSSSDPLAATKQANHDLFFAASAPSQAETLQTAGYKPVDPNLLVAQSGNVAVLDNGSGDYHYSLMTREGFSMGSVGMSDAAGLLSLMDDYGVDKSSLTELADQLDTKGIAYQPGTLGSGSDHGIDLKNLAAGGLGTSYDWRVDDNAALKDSALVGTGVSNFALESIATAKALADRLGIQSSNGITLPSVASPTATSTSSTNLTIDSNEANISESTATTDANNLELETSTAASTTTTSEASIEALTTQLSAWSQQLTSQGSVNMSEFLGSYHQMQSLLTQIDQLKQSALN